MPAKRPRFSWSSALTSIDNTGKVIIGDWLKGGEKVVVAGGQLLHPGMLVEIAQQGAQP